MSIWRNISSRAHSTMRGGARGGVVECTCPKASPITEETQPAETVTPLKPHIVPTQIPTGAPINQIQLVAIKPGRVWPCASWCSLSQVTLFPIFEHLLCSHRHVQTPNTSSAGRTPPPPWRGNYDSIHRGHTLRDRCPVDMVAGPIQPVCAIDIGRKGFAQRALENIWHAPFA